MTDDASPNVDVRGEAGIIIANLESANAHGSVTSRLVVVHDSADNPLVELF